MLHDHVNLLIRMDRKHRCVISRFVKVLGFPGNLQPDQDVLLSILTTQPLSVGQKRSKNVLVVVFGQI